MRTRLFVFGVLFAACTGSTGPAGQNGQNGQNGSNGSNGTNGNDIILSERAKIGLDIAPVALKLDGKTGPEIEAIGQGSYWVNAVIDCSGCHSGQVGYLSGGNKFPFDADGDFVVSRNLTPDPTGLMLSEADFLTAMQTGKDFSTANEIMIVMPWLNFRWMHEDDLKAIYAYLKVIPAVANPNLADSKGPAKALTPIPLPSAYDRGAQTRALLPEKDFMGNKIPDPDGTIRGYEVNPLPDPDDYPFFTGQHTASFGRGSYLVNAAACNDCHTNPPYGTVPGPDFLRTTTTAFLTGGDVFVTPTGLGPVFGTTRSMSANIIGSNGFLWEPGMNFSLFQEIIATGTHFDDDPPTPLAWPMPWDHFRNMTASDQAALYDYLTDLAFDVSNGPTKNTITQGPALYCDSTHTCPGGMTCHMGGGTPDLGNECVGNDCTSDADCGACQRCDTATTQKCVAPDDQAHIACALGAGI